VTPRENGLLSRLRKRETALSEHEYAALLGISYDKARMDRKNGRGPTHVRLKGRVIYLPEDVLAFLEAQRQ
jgi:hypothetical protein